MVAYGIPKSKILPSKINRIVRFSLSVLAQERLTQQT
ncbi:hypothetical protein OK016_00750 [Vibrio chagasii]|nr:hypothetical protein [Vibrio chagasii]